MLEKEKVKRRKVRSDVPVETLQIEALTAKVFTAIFSDMAFAVSLNIAWNQDSFISTDMVLDRPSPSTWQYNFWSISMT